MQRNSTALWVEALGSIPSMGVGEGVKDVGLSPMKGRIYHFRGERSVPCLTYCLRFLVGIKKRHQIGSCTGMIGVQETRSLGTREPGPSLRHS
jgi:hypothetical protein